MGKCLLSCHPNCFYVEKFIFESEGELLAQDENLLFLWHLFSPSTSSYHLLPISTTRTHTKANMSPSLKKQTQYLCFYSPSVHLVCFHCCDPVLCCFSHFMVLHPKLPLQSSTWYHFSCGRGGWEKRSNDICQLKEKNLLAETLLKIKLSSRKKNRTKAVWFRWGNVFLHHFVY